MSPVQPTELHPEDAQRRAARPDASVWVAASAGTGKTKVLTDRVLALMLSGTAPRHILCLTFTKAAAAEMSGRVASLLGAWTRAGDEDLDNAIKDILGSPPDDALRTRARRLFAEVLDTPGGMNVQTIHAFCQSLLGRFPIEARVAPHFSVMDERDAQDMLARARETVLHRARDDDALEGALSSVTRHIHESTFADLMKALSAARGRLKRLLRDHGTPEKAVLAARRQMGLGDRDTAASVIAAACCDDAMDKLGLSVAAAALDEGTKTDVARADAIRAWLDTREDDRAPHFNTYAKAFLVSDRDKIRDKLATKKVADVAPDALDILAVEAKRLLGVEMRRRAAITAEATAGLLHLGAALLDAYETQKKDAALLDYDDLILAARDLLQREGTAPWVLYKLDGGISHVLVDEAQDTSPEQWAVASAITDEFFSGRTTHEDEVRTLFAVGDVKQSIYSFQGADPAVFRSMRERFAKIVPAGGGVWDEVPLNISFRSTPAVLAAVDAIFASDDARAGVTLDGGEIEHKAWRAGDGGVVELWPPTEPEDTDAPGAWKPPVERVSGSKPETRLAQTIARRIKAMIETNEILESQARPIRAGDVMVLVRRRTGFVEDLVRELKRLNVEVAGVDRMVLTEQLAVMDLIALGRFLLLPDDDLTLATVLKGPLIGLDEDDLFTLAHGRAGTLWSALKAQAGTDPRFKAACDTLSDLLAEADYRPPFELYAHVLGTLGGRRKLMERLGVEAADPIAEFMGLALRFERSHAISLQGFLHWVEAGGVEIKRDMEESTRDAVRIMTVHGAKGLQAPIVFLPDTLQVPRTGETLLWPETEASGTTLVWPPASAYVEPVAEAERERMKVLRDQEYRRLLYVALTRAEDRLYISGWANRTAAPDDCWYNIIRSGLEQAAGAEETENGTLRLASPQTRTPKPKPTKDAFAPADALPDWAERSAPEETAPAVLRPSMIEGEEPPVRSPFADDDGARFRRGLLIHKLLEMLPTLPLDRREAAARAWLSRPTHGLDPETQDAITTETLAVLNHPDFAHLFGVESRAEVSIAGRVGTHMISGQVDRLVIGTNDIIVVDYKTNRPPPEDEGTVPAPYLRQMAAYRAALRAIYPEKRVTCVLLWTDALRLMPLSDGILDSYAPT